MPLAPLADHEVPRALVVGAHPDDIDFGAAGTTARWAAAGTQVTYLLVTYGEQGGFDDTPRGEVPALREAEQRAAAKAAGVDDVRFLSGYRDGRLEVTDGLVRDLARVIRQVRPARVLGQSPERWWDRLPASHPDHLAAGEATVRAVYPAARNAFAYPELLDDEGLQPWTVSELWLAAHPLPDHFVDVTETLEVKFAALAAHRSQTAHSMDDIRRTITRSLADAAAAAGLGEGRYAESFKVVHAA
jgi:LmbE family N-acetylglucosaminyl deacetylase